MAPLDHSGIAGHIVAAPEDVAEEASAVLPAGVVDGAEAGAEQRTHTHQVVRPHQLGVADEHQHGEVDGHPIPLQTPALPLGRPQIEHRILTQTVKLQPGMHRLVRHTLTTDGRLPGLLPARVRLIRTPMLGEQLLRGLPVDGVVVLIVHGVARHLDVLAKLQPPSTGGSRLLMNRLLHGSVSAV